MTLLAYLWESSLPEYYVLTRHLWGVILTGELSTRPSVSLGAHGILFLFHAAAAAASLEIAVFYVSRNGLSPSFPLRRFGGRPSGARSAGVNE